MLTKKEFINKVVADVRKDREDIISEPRVRDCLQEHTDWIDDTYNRYVNDVETHEDYWISSLGLMIDMSL